MSKVIIYIATSIDGYIARTDGDISFLDSVSSENQDYGYADFISTVDAVIMGRKTYEKILTFGDYPHQQMQSYIITSRKYANQKNINFYNGDLSALIQKLKSQNGKDIFIDGGAELIDALIRLDVVDRYIISFIPVLLGDGIRLFKSGRIAQDLKHLDSKAFESGLIQMKFERNKKHS